MDAKIKIGYLISYDYSYLMTSLEAVYKYADEIVLCYDKNFQTWSGNTFVIPNAFFESIQKFDKKNKIKFYKDTFFFEENLQNPMKSETIQRNKLGEFMGIGGWHIQLDVDEYVYDFKKMIDFLKESEFLLENPEKNPFSIIAELVVLFKKDENGFYVIKPTNEKFYFATNNPKYIRARQTSWTCILTKHKIIHQSWAREEDEIKQKLDNWGHKKDFDGEKYFNVWKNINNDNYRNLIDFHPVEPKVWHKLEFYNFKNIKLLLKKSPKLFPQESTLIALKKLENYIELPRKLRKKINSKLKWQKRFSWLKLFSK
jgi:hypothetical protein